MARLATLRAAPAALLICLAAASEGGGTGGALVRLDCAGAPDAMCLALEAALRTGRPGLAVIRAPEGDGAPASLDLTLRVLEVTARGMTSQLIWRAAGEDVTGPEVRFRVIDTEFGPHAYGMAMRGLLQASAPPL